MNLDKKKYVIKIYHAEIHFRCLFLFCMHNTLVGISSRCRNINEKKQW